MPKSYIKILVVFGYMTKIRKSRYVRNAAYINTETPHGQNKKNILKKIKIKSNIILSYYLKNNVINNVNIIKINIFI